MLIPTGIYLDIQWKEAGYSLLPKTPTKQGLGYKKSAMRTNFVVFPLVGNI